MIILCGHVLLVPSTNREQVALMVLIALLLGAAPCLMARGRGVEISTT